MGNVVLIVLVVVVCFPFMVYMSVKLGTCAYFQGKALFERESEDGKK